MTFKGKVAIITGGGQGIGETYAKRFAAQGASVVIAELNEEAGQRVAEEIRQAGNEAIFVKTDVSSENDAAAVASVAQDMFDGIDILVNNAGIQGNKYTVEQIDEEIWEAMTFIKMKATFFAARAVIPGMKKRKYGKLINVSSIFAMEGSFSMSHYTGAASGVLGYAKGWARELAPWNICANAVAPGTVATDLTINSMGWDVIHDFEKTVPMGRLADKKEIAYAVAWLASPESDFVTGQLISPTGGQTIVGI